MIKSFVKKMHRGEHLVRPYFAYKGTSLIHQEDSHSNQMEAKHDEKAPNGFDNDHKNFTLRSLKVIAVNVRSLA